MYKISYFSLSQNKEKEINLSASTLLQGIEIAEDLMDGNSLQDDIGGLFVESTEWHNPDFAIVFATKEFISFLHKTGSRFRNMTDWALYLSAARKSFNMGMTIRGKYSRYSPIQEENQPDEEIDLFAYPERQPEKLRRTIDAFWEQFEDDPSIEDLEDLLQTVNQMGYTFEYGLDAVPYNLRPFNSNEKS